MSTLPDKIKFDFDSWNIKITERRRNRMKLQIKLDKDQALAFKNFTTVCKPEEVSDNDFIKTIFLTGVEAMNKELAELVKEYAKENKEELAASGITVLEGEDGQIQLADTTVYETDLSGASSPVDPTNFLDKAQTADKLNEDNKKE
tara:strand:+ start:41 stop:478 length:438 start_codon:yes stop_codon:yes gene_type:complete